MVLSEAGESRINGYLFVLDRATGKPILPVEERPVKQNPRLATAPTQPYPVGVDKVGVKGLSYNAEADRRSFAAMRRLFSEVFAEPKK